MYSAMPSGKKGERVNFRIAEDLKADAEILAEVYRWDLTTLITTRLNEEIKEVRKNNPQGFEDAARRVQETARHKTGKKKARVIYERTAVSGMHPGKKKPTGVQKKTGTGNR